MIENVKDGWMPGRDAVLRAALDAAIDGHALWAPLADGAGGTVDLVAVYLNPAGAAIHRITAEEFPGRRLSDWARQLRSPEFGEALLAVAQSGQPLRRRFQLSVDRAQSRSSRWQELSAVRLDGGLSVSFRDVTEEVGTRAALEAANGELAAANRRLTRLASTDPLTGLDNRRAWTLALTDHLTSAATTGRPLVVALLDLDQFKAYNDTHGHPAGDDLLRAVAMRWSARLPAGTTLARLGGEEFAVALPDTEPAAARLLLTELCSLVPDGQTSSAGMTVWDGVEDDSRLVGRADAALYAAKRAGRSRIEALLPL